MLSSGCQASKKEVKSVKDDDLEMDKIDDGGKNDLQLEDSDNKLGEVEERDKSGCSIQNL